MSYTQYSVCLAELMRGAGISTPTHGYKPEQAFADGRKLLDRITELEAQLSNAKQVANDCRIVADNAIAEAGAIKLEVEALRKDAARWEYAMQTNRFGIVNIYNIANGKNSPRTPKGIAEFIDAAIKGEQA